MDARLGRAVRRSVRRLRRRWLRREDGNEGGPRRRLLRSDAGTSARGRAPFAKPSGGLPRRRSPLREVAMTLRFGLHAILVAASVACVADCSGKIVHAGGLVLVMCTDGSLRPDSLHLTVRGADGSK